MMNYIAHHGIKGQKWGVRRYQNKDGSLTALGKERYYSDSDSDRIFNQLNGKAKIVPGNRIFKKVVFDYSEQEDIKEAATFLKKQHEVVKDRGVELQKAFQTEVSNFINDPKNTNKVFDLVKEYYNEYDNEYIPDGYDVQFAVAQLISDKYFKSNADKLSEYHRMIDTYGVNIAKITSDIIGSLGDTKIKALADEKNIFGTQKKKKRKYRDVISNTLERAAGGSMFDFPELEYAGDDLGGLDDLLGPKESEFYKYCDTLANEYSRRVLKKDKGR